MKESLLKRKLRNDEPAFGVMGTTIDPMFAEIAGHLGFDFYIIDGEHGAIGPAEAQSIVRACEAVGITPLARIRSIDAKLILQFLDAGVMGVQMPGIMNADDVRRLVEAIRYPPLGKRGLGPMRAAEYTLGRMPQSEYVALANDQILVLPQIEDIEAVNHLQEIVRVQGVDGFILGPRDLSMSMGYYDGPDHDEVRAVIDHVYETVRAAGLFLGGSAGSAEATRADIQRGLRLSITSLNYLISTTAVPFLKAVRSS